MRLVFTSERSPADISFINKEMLSTYLTSNKNTMPPYWYDARRTMQQLLQILTLSSPKIDLAS